MPDRPRAYGLYVPTGLPAGRPLVVMLHGTGASGDRLRAATSEQMDRLADQERFAVAYPDALHGGWFDCRKSTPAMLRDMGIDDVGFLRALIADVRARHQIDPARIYLFGHSGGGHMAFRMAWEAPGEVAAIAVNAASLPPADGLTCMPAGNTRVMLVKGTADTINPYEGGVHAAGGTVLSAPATALAFAKMGGLDQAAAEQAVYEGAVDDPTTVSLRAWHRGAVPFVALYTVRNGGHTVPQPALAYPPQFGATSKFDSLRAAWRFFTGQ